MILDLFAGPGGWDEALAGLGCPELVGVDHDRWACATGEAAGHTRHHGDVTALPTDAFGSVDGLVGSPPCQAWTVTGGRGGEHDIMLCHRLIERTAAGDDGWAGRQSWRDPRSALVGEPLRWVRDLRPGWVAMEEVPAVAGLWRHLARILAGWGYRTWTGVLSAADYGVPQTRRRAFLLAHHQFPVAPPDPTHARPGLDRLDLFGVSRRPWVTMADALGWTASDVPAGAGWVLQRPATTVVGSYAADVIAAPGYRTIHSRQHQPGSVQVTAAQAGVLQGFPPRYPWQGPVSKQRQQIGNAVPPPLARHVLTALHAAPARPAGAAA